MQNDQKKIWDHFQGEAIQSFDLAVPRLCYLLASANRLAGGQQWQILNIGTGNGWLEQACHAKGWRTYTLDPSALAVQRVQQYGIPGQVGLIEQAPFDTGSFDAIFCSEVFEHLVPRQLDQGLAEIKRMLRPHGYLIGTVPFNEALKNGETVCPECGTVFHRWGHQQSFTKPSMRAILQAAQLKVVALQVQAFPYFEHPSLVNLAKTSLIKLIGRFGVQSMFPSLCFVARNT